jgi:hypothetical protein
MDAEAATTLFLSHGVDQMADLEAHAQQISLSSNTIKVQVLKLSDHSATDMY